MTIAVRISACGKGSAMGRPGCVCPGAIRGALPRVSPLAVTQEYRGENVCEPRAALNGERDRELYSEQSE